jgi:hypothetical protein
LFRPLRFGFCDSMSVAGLLKYSTTISPLGRAEARGAAAAFGGHR